jgi:Virulence factor BrkB
VWCDGNGQARRPFANVFHLQPDRGLEFFARFCWLLHASITGLRRGPGPPPIRAGPCLKSGREPLAIRYRRRPPTAGGGPSITGGAGTMFQRSIAAIGSGNVPAHLLVLFSLGRLPVIVKSMLRSKRAETDASRSDGRALFPVVALLAAAAAIEYLFPGGSQRLGMSSSAGSRAATDDDGRGRLATTPSEIPPRGWKDILLRVYSNVSEHRILSLAAGMTYYSLLAIFPALAALVAVYGLFADPSAIARHLDQVAGVLPSGAIDVAREQLTRVASKGPQTLGLTFLVGLGVSLWSANAAMKSLFDTLNIVYGEEEKRGFVKLNAMSLLFTVGGILFVMAALGAIVVIPVTLKYIGLSEVADLAQARADASVAARASAASNPKGVDLRGMLAVDTVIIEVLSCNDASMRYRTQRAVGVAGCRRRL